MALDTTNLTKFLKGITDAIRTKTGSTDPIEHKKIDEEINKLCVLTEKSKDNKSKLMSIIGGYFRYADESAYSKPSVRLNYDYVFSDDMWTNDLIEYLNLNTSNATSCTGIYYGNDSITYTPNLDFTNSTKCDQMFESCSNLESVESLELNNARFASFLFCDCKNLINADVNIPNAADIQSMFLRCSKLETVKFHGTPKACTIFNMFGGCSSLKSVINISFSSVNKDASSFSTNILDSSRELETILFEKESIYLKKFNCATSSDKLTDETIQSVIDGYAYTDYSKTCRFNSKVVERITDEQLLQAANKNLEIG